MAGFDQGEDKPVASESEADKKVEALNIDDAFERKPTDKDKPVSASGEAGFAVVCDMLVSDAGFMLLKEYEGLRLRPYKDSRGYAIGYGHRLRGTDNHEAGISEAQAEEFLSQDVEKSKAVVEELVNVPLTQGQLDALSSFVFNIGRRNFMTSTMLKKLNSSDYEGAAREFERWIYSGNRQLRGLIRRRNAEKNLFQGNGAYPTT